MILWFIMFDDIVSLGLFFVLFFKHVCTRL